MKKFFQNIILLACIEKNIGDDLFVYVICKRYKNCNFIIKKDAEYGDLIKIENLSFSILIKYLSKFSNYQMIQSPIKRVIGKLIFRSISLLVGHKNFIVYIVGNTFKNYKYIGKKQIQWLKNLVGLSSKFYLLSTNYGPCNDDRWINDCSEVFEDMNDICFRDKESYNIFSNLNKVRYAPDAVLTLKTDIAKKIGDKNVIISMINCREKYMDSVKMKADEYEAKLAKLADKFIENGYDVTLMCSNTFHDLPAATRIKNNSKYSEKIIIFKYDGNIEDVFELYRTTKYVISTRLHSMILAWVFKTPVFPISYDIKVSNLINSYSFNNQYCELSEIEKLTYEDIINSFRKYDYSFFDKLVKDAENQFQKLDLLLGHKN